ncbi:MAG: integrase [Alphaproteobacteria bacterium]|jgi:integrase
MRLTDVALRNAKPCSRPVKLSDGKGLYFEVRPTGAKLWRYRYRIAGKENVFAIGEYPNISLAEAREIRAEAKTLVSQGIHPAHQRRASLLAKNVENATTFQAVANEWITKKKPNCTPYYIRQIESFMDGDVFPYIGKLPIRAVTAAHLLEVLQRVESRGAETVAINLRQWCSAIFRYAVSTLRADGDPASALKGALHKPKTEHRRPLSREEIAQFIDALQAYGGYRTTVIALRLMLLTFVRTKELREASWKEFDLEQAEWRIPAQRMKMRDAHMVPLSKQAVELLRELYTLTGGRDYILPNYRDPSRCMTATTLNRALERMGLNGTNTIGFSAHGFRATASTILNELGCRPEVIERQLAHKERNQVRASYNQAEYVAERRAMMQLWADLIEKTAKLK